ncbi:Aldo/keto reductase family protein [Amycolatopsis sp. YIM 10]|nr:Aldo/keto reductase family protein [Amycolatopsis sp. YIM 10]
MTAVQTEYSLWTRGVEEELLPTLKVLGAGLVPYSPLGHGFLSQSWDQDAAFIATSATRRSSASLLPVAA